MARQPVGSVGVFGSIDFFQAFITANKIPEGPERLENGPCLRCSACTSFRGSGENKSLNYFLLFYVITLKMLSIVRHAITV